MSKNKNDITNDTLISGPPTEKFSSGWDAIWGKKTTKDVQEILDSPSIMLPKGQSTEEMRQFILKSIVGDKLNTH